MNSNFRWSFRLRIMLYTFISMAAAALSDIMVLLISIRFDFMTIRYGRIPDPAVTGSYDASASLQNGSASANAGEAIIGEDNIIYRIFGVGIRWQLVLIILLVSVTIFTLCFLALTRSLTDYINNIVTGIGKISSGDFEERIPVRDNDEFSYIASQINQMAASIQGREASAQEAETTKNDLITNVAHDLRTPLTSVIGYIDLALNNDTDEEKRKEYLGIAASKASKLGNMIEELFSLSKTGYSHEPMNLSRIDLIKLLEQEIDEMYPIFEQNDLKCTFSHDRGSVYIMADGERMMRVFDNLLGNAVRYGSDGKLIQVISRTYDYSVEVKVINFGNIIPKEKLPYLFEKFYKADGSRSPSSRGTGLGLSIAKAIVENHNGTISAGSDIDGTVFTVTLPVSS